MSELKKSYIVIQMLLFRQFSDRELKETIQEKAD